MDALVMAYSQWGTIDKTYPRTFSEQNLLEKPSVAREFLKDKDNRQELESLTPSILQTDGEVKFRQCFEMLYPLFLPRLRERVPSITRREELPPCSSS